jgi:hypothetical protein
MYSNSMFHTALLYLCLYNHSMNIIQEVHVIGSIILNLVQVF